MKPLPVPLLTFGAFCALALPLSAPSGRAALTSAAEEPVTLRVAPERDYVYRRGPREIVLEVEVKARRPDNSRRSPVNVSVVLDHSGSMEGAKIEKARQAACVALDRLDADDIFSLVIYDNDAEVLLAPERAGSREHRENMKERINRIRPGGSTALYAGVQLGARQVRKFLEKERVNRVILLSDGIANVGPSSTRDLANLGRDLRGDGLSVTTIGVGDDFNEDLMTALAEASHANYYYVKDAEKLPGIFNEELGAAGTRIAGDIRIRIEAPSGVRLREVLGHPEISCKDRSAEIVLPELFGSEHRLFHLRCAIEETSAESLPLAMVALNYEDTASKQRQSQNRTATVRLTDDSKQSDESIQNEIVKNVGVVQNRLDKEAAVKLADEGRAKEAAELLRRRAVSNAAAPAARQMPGMAAENKKLEGLADELSTSGALQKSSRKAAQWDNYQDKYQKK
jgi:Ca-activated chloride channel family protein